MYVNLPHRFKGTHMSRFVEILNRFHGEINLQSFHRMLQEMKERLDAEASHMEIRFPYFMQRAAGDGSIGSERYECRMHGSLQERSHLVMEITVPVFSPPSLHISGSLPSSPGRWGTARVAVRFNHFIWIEDLIALIEEGLASGGGSPVSVETVTAALGRALAGNRAVSWYSITVENLADGYSTFATLEGRMGEMEEHAG
jgi:GTP cyclohydrolase I